MSYQLDGDVAQRRDAALEDGRARGGGLGGQEKRVAYFTDNPQAMRRIMEREV